MFLRKMCFFCAKSETHGEKTDAKEVFGEMDFFCAKSIHPWEEARMTVDAGL